MRNDDRSVLAEIEATGGAVPHLRLRDEASGDAPAAPLETGRLRETGHYEIVGEIARGGVGAILKGRDVDLGRDVAIKVLRESHGGNRELVLRLVEEAQIAGQLQHPGIVPVYELGIAEGGRPYFSMKLVKGETLASRLAARTAPGDGDHGLLGVFQQVLSSLAYVHARGVVHRDLKPSNVMIGSFGEVLVVDWGFAKVLPRGGVADERRADRDRLEVTRIATMRSSGEGTESIAGSIMGTPAYMPPEQALGQVDALDERSDVFALGAILTEILTGAPAYVGEPEEMVVLAAQAKLDDAYARLDACGADPALVDLAKRCLAPLRRDRPRDAGVLAEEVGAHLLAVEERERRSRVTAIEAKEAAAHARVEAAEVRARAEAERTEEIAQHAKAEAARHRSEEARAESEAARRRRRQSLAIAAALLLAVVIGAGGFALLDQGRRARRRALTAEVEATLRDVSRLRAAGDLDAAVLAAAAAHDLAAAGGAPAALAERVDAVVAGARDAKASAERDAATAERLEAVFLDPAADYAAAFAASGLDLADPGVVDRIRGSAIRPRLLEALHDAAAREPSRRASLLGIADAVDADPERTEIRRTFAAGDRTALLARAVGEPALDDATTYDLLAAALSALGEPLPTLRVLEAGWVRHPGAFRLHVRLARTFRTLDHPDWMRVAAHLAAAASLRPSRPDLATARDEAIRQANAEFDLEGL